MPDFFPKLGDRGKDIVRAVGSASDEAYSRIYVTLVSAINSAESQVHITNAYIVPDEQLLEALQAAALRGVDVKLIVPSHTDFWAVFHAGRAHYTELLKAGVKIYERQGALLHSKTASIDGVWSCVGSTNLDWRSFLHNNEIDAVVLGDEFAGADAGNVRKGSVAIGAHRSGNLEAPSGRRPLQRVGSRIVGILAVTGG